MRCWEPELSNVEQRQLAILSSVVAVVMIYFAYATTQRDSALSASFVLGDTPASPSELPPEILMSHNDGKSLLLQLDMSYYTRTEFDISFQEQPLEGWCVHLGDSPGNDGWGGDDGRFSNNAEWQITGQGGAMALFGNDYLLEKDPNAQGNMIAAELNFVAPRQQVTLKVQDGLVSWDNRGGKVGQNQSEFLFSLNGQPDAKQGKANDKIIFAAFNRAIAKADPGRCVSGVRVTLLK
jgi:hypothetical protein